MSPKIAFLLISLVFAVGACAPKKDSSVDQDPLEQAYKRIDLGEYGGAIADLEVLALTDTRSEVRQALASAYAGRAGVRIDTLWGFMVGFNAPLLSVEKLQATQTIVRAQRILAQFGGQSNGREARTIVEIAKFLSGLELWRERIDQLPLVHGAARVDVDRAVAVLTGESSRGGRLYRALLGLVTLKSDMAEGFNGWTRISDQLAPLDLSKPESPANRAVLCQLDGRRFAVWAGQVVARLTSTVDDVGVAYPSKQKELRRALQDSRGLSQGLAQIGGGGCS